MSRPLIKQILAVFFFFTQVTSAFADKKIFEAPDFYKENLAKKSFDLDPAAEAIVLYEGATYYIEKNMQGEYATIKKFRKIIKVLKSSAVKVADVKVSIHSSKNFFGSISKVKASTYNLSNGEVVKKDMPDDAIKIEKESDYRISGKFSLPSVSEGSIIDYSYELKTEFTTIIAFWEIEETYPKLITEVSLQYPDGVKLALTTQNIPEFIEFDDKKAEDTRPDSYYIPTVSTGGGYYYKRWVRRNVQANADEPLLYNFHDYSERIVFNVASMKVTNTIGGYQIKSSTGFRNWLHYNMEVLKDKNVFGQLKNDKYLPAKQFLAKIDNKSTDKTEYAKIIYNYVRDSFTYKDEFADYTTREIDWVMRNNSGNHLDYHLALITALREAGMDAYPVLLSTRRGIKLLSDFPNRENVDFVLTWLNVGGQTYLLDPTDRFNPFGTVHPECYNGFAWVANDTGMGIQLNPDEIKERMSIQVKTINNDKADYQLSFRKVYGKFSAIVNRENWVSDTLKIKEDVLTEVKSLGLDAKLKEYHVSNLYNADTSLVLEYTLKCDFTKDNLFFTPSLFNYFAECPLKSEKRHNPVEMPYTTEYNYSLALKLPDGYAVDNVPTPEMLTFADSYYKYLVNYEKESSLFILNTKFNLQRSFFEPAEYSELKSFLDKVIEMQRKTVVIKKML